MAEFCLDCLNKLDGTDLTEADVILSDEFCEGCGKIVPCVVRFRDPWERTIWSFLGILFRELWNLFRELWHRRKKGAK